MNSITVLPIDKLHRRQDARPLNDDVVAALAESVEQIGLINPIRVREDGASYEVVAGSHRFAACDLAGLHEIPCIVVTDDDLHAELAMIDENLCRAELSPSERAQQTARRKTLYERLHPETKHGQNIEIIPSGQFVRTDKPSFTEATAKAVGRDERSVRRDAERGEKITPEAHNLIVGTKLDKGVYLDQLKRVEPEQQVERVKADLTRGGIAGRYQSAPESKSDPVRTAERFVALVDQIEALPVDDLVSSGRMRAQVGQRASGLADHMTEILERLNR